MTLFGGDLFETWRRILALACGVYTIIVTGRSLWGWYEYFTAPERGRKTLRRYATVQFLRLRLTRFAGEFVQLALLALALVWLLKLHAA